MDTVCSGRRPRLTIEDDVGGGGGYLPARCPGDRGTIAGASSTCPGSGSGSGYRRRTLTDHHHHPEPGQVSSVDDVRASSASGAALDVSTHLSAPIILTAQNEFYQHPLLFGVEAEQPSGDRAQHSSSPTVSNRSSSGSITIPAPEQRLTIPGLFYSQLNSIRTVGTRNNISGQEPATDGPSNLVNGKSSSSGHTGMASRYLNDRYQSARSTAESDYSRAQQRNYDRTASQGSADLYEHREEEEEEEEEDYHHHQQQQQQHPHPNHNHHDHSNLNSYYDDYYDEDDIQTRVSTPQLGSLKQNRYSTQSTSKPLQPLFDTSTKLNYENNVASYPPGRNSSSSGLIGHDSIAKLNHPLPHSTHNQQMGEERGVLTGTHTTSRRPPVWRRIIWDTTPLDLKIINHQNGVGIQDRAYICYLLSLAMFIALILELVANAKYQGSPISTKPTFNYMIGPSALVMINAGARFTPCIKYVPNVSNISFPCLNSTSSTDIDCSSNIETICGLGGFKKPGVPDQTFRFVLPLFLHAGLIHYVINIIVQMSSSALIERQMGSLRFMMLYIPSGIFGFILGGNFSLVGQPSVGASGSLFSTHAAFLVDLISHWQIEYRPARKLAFLLFEIVAGLALGLIPGIDNFSHIGGFGMGLLLSVILFPVLHQTKTHRFSFYALRLICLAGAALMFVFLYKNFFTDDPASSCNWCRFLSCWPTASNNVGLMYRFPPTPKTINS